ncbi:T-complex protein 1 subunit theta, partial [Bonamia ostreae]
MIKNMRSGMPSLFKKGSKSFEGLASTERSLKAVIKLAEMIETSFGPNALNKIVINSHDKISVTSDTAAILENLEINHPVAKMVVGAAKMQEKEIGDGSNLVILFAGELCKIAIDLIKEGVQINDIVEGYSMAIGMVPSILDSIKRAEKKESSKKIIKTAISSKIHGFENRFADLIADGCLAVSKDDYKNIGFDVDSIRTKQVAAGSLRDSFLSFGIVVNGDFEAIGPNNADFEIKDAAVCVFNGSVDAQTTETKGVVLFENAEQMLNFNKDEEKRVENSIIDLKNLNTKLIVTGGKFGDIALHFMSKHKIAGLKISSKFELRRVAKLVRCRAVPLFGEKVDKEDLGFLKIARSKEIGSKKLVFLEQDRKDAQFATIVVRGATESFRESGEKAVDDGVNAIKTASKDQRTVLGGGASEIQMATRMRSEKQFGESEMALRFGVDGFASALEAIPRRLAKSAGLDDYAKVAEMVSVHSKSPDAVLGVSFI